MHGAFQPMKVEAFQNSLNLTQGYYCRLVHIFFCAILAVDLLRSTLKTDVIECKGTRARYFIATATPWKLRKYVIFAYFRAKLHQNFIFGIFLEVISAKFIVHFIQKRCLTSSFQWITGLYFEFLKNSSYRKYFTLSPLSKVSPLDSKPVL